MSPENQSRRYMPIIKECAQNVLAILFSSPQPSPAGEGVRCRSDFVPVPKCIAVIFLVLLSTGCARTYQARYVETSHFLDDYSLLKDGEDGDALLSFWKEGANWAAYKKIILEPVITSKLPDSDLNDMTHAENHRLKELFEYRMREALKKNFGSARTGARG